jgi:LacI family transcriptional regulator
MASIRDVAQAAGVSPATVSRTFTTPSLCNAQTQRRVLEAAKLLDYRPPRLRTVRGLRGDGSGAGPGSGGSSGSISVEAGPNKGRTLAREAIGFQFFSATSSPLDTIARNTFYLSVLVGAQAEAAALGMHLLMHSTNRHDLSVEVPKMVQEQAIGGMLLVGTADPAVFAVFARHVPNLVLVDSRDETGTFESVISDGFGGAYLATRYLQELGHRRIGFLLPEPGIVTFQDRLHGWLCAMFESGNGSSGALLDPSWVFGTDADEDRRQELFAAFLRQPASSRPTAVVCANDQNALILLRVCRDLGVRVPYDLSVVGYDDAEGAEHAHPALTTMRVDKEFMGRLAVRRLWSRLHGEHEVCLTQPQVRHETPVTLVERASCRARVVAAR